VSAPFSRTTIVAVAAVAGVSLIVTVVLMVVGDDVTRRPTAGANSYSTSAIGHLGLVRLLERLDVPVRVSRGGSTGQATDGLLIVAEPTLGADDLSLLVGRARRVLVVLPKWRGRVAPGRAWLTDVAPVPIVEVEAVLAAIGLPHAEVRRGGGLVSAAGGWPAPEIIEPQAIGGTDVVREVAAGAGGALVARVDRDGGPLYVLADPDVLSNAGLRRPANAQFAAALIEHLRDGGPVVVDETAHGFTRTASLARALFEVPLVLATVQGLVCAVLAVWAAMMRFGPRRAPPPPRAPGKEFLIHNTAALLAYGGHHGHALARYLQLAIAAVRTALHAPALAPPAAAAWLEQVRIARGGRISLAELEQAVPRATTPGQIVEIANQIFRWRMEMTHGADSRS
jgi:hypothetical protein